MHQKIDLLTDKEMADFETKVGDILLLDVPGEQGKRECLVTEIEILDAGNHPETGQHLTRVTLSLE
jgi:hypothetical protein